jgi:tetratricopeptide (TPR) repeat protein
VVQRAPDQAGARHLLGLVHAQRGDGANALALIERALALDPDLAEAHCDLGDLHRRAGRSSEANASYRAAIARDPAMAKAWSALGAMLHGTGDSEGAIAAWRQAIALAPAAQDQEAGAGRQSAASRRDAKARSAHSSRRTRDARVQPHKREVKPPAAKGRGPLEPVTFLVRVSFRWRARRAAAFISAAARRDAKATMAYSSRR